MPLINDDQLNAFKPRICWVSADYRIDAGNADLSARFMARIAVKPVLRLDDGLDELSRRNDVVGYALPVESERYLRYQL